ncbi:MAG: hypothetical protein RLY20_2663 [Verrucomicrobiota bacterium]|jgi:hypothetical protein
MKPKSIALGLLLCSFTCIVGIVRADDEKTAATSTEDREAFYTQNIEQRTADILKALDLKDSAKAARLHDVIVVQYRSLRARDAAVAAKLKEQGKSITDAAARGGLTAKLTKPLHEWFVSVLAMDLTPEQLTVVKDRMTYNKVKVTFDAYCDIIPNLTDPEKKMIQEKLEAARDEAIDGGSAAEKSAAFQKYKDQINAQLTANGHDVQKAYKEWEAKQAAKQASAGNAPASAAAK